MNKLRIIGVAIVMISELSICSCAQNLVANPGFEDYKKLPCKLNEALIQALVNQWSQPLATTTDYFNTLSDISCEQNPLFLGKSPRTGSAMVGMVTALYVRNFPAEYKEYIQASLVDSLRKDHFYYGSFYALNRNKIYQAEDILEANNIGMTFTQQPISKTGDTKIDHLILKAQIKDKNVIPADDTWHKVSGCFLADSSYRNLLIGNFDSIDSTKYDRLTNSQEEANAYHYIDDVTVVELPYDVKSLKNVVAFCPDKDSVVLNALVPGATNYSWPDRSDKPTFQVKVKSNVIYTVQISFNECIYQHQFKVNYQAAISLPPDTLLCRGEILKLKPGDSHRQYLWSDGSADSVKFISSPGTYAVEVLGAPGCEIHDSVTVKYIDCPGFVPNVFTPNGDGANPKFAVENIENRQWSLQVFNRWGQVVYQSQNYKNDWDGKGLLDGIYYYLLYAPSLDKRVKGWVQVIH